MAGWSTSTKIHMFCQLEGSAAEVKLEMDEEGVTRMAAPSAHGRSLSCCLRELITIVLHEAKVKQHLPKLRYV